MSESQQSEPVEAEAAASEAEPEIIEIGAGTDTGVGIETGGLNIELEDIQSQAIEVFQKIVEWAQSPQFYAQIGLIVGAILVAFFASKIIGKYLKPPSDPVQPGSMGKTREFLYKLRGILFPLCCQGRLREHPVFQQVNR